jgi:LmbE family N-acetylglucosaminyl deacetylase
MKLLLAPHCDDETLFAAYTILRHRPLVIICYDGRPRYWPPDVREAESAAALAILGATYRHLHCDPDDRGALELALRAYEPEAVWAPLPEQRGDSHHNRVGEVALALWPERLTYYTTYTDADRSIQGDRVPEEAGWPELKQQALGCYRSQIEHPGTRPHFERGLAEYVVAGPALCIVCGKPVGGYRADPRGDGPWHEDCEEQAIGATR